MNFSFSNSVSFGSDGSMIIKNGSQTIKMGQGGMVIHNSGGQQIVMNNSGVQFSNQQNQYTGPNFHMQTNFYTSQNGYGQEEFEEDSSDEMSYPDPSEDSDDNTEYWQQGGEEEEYEDDDNTQSGSYHAPGVNVTWQVNHNVNYYSPSTYSYSNSQSSEMSQQQQQPKKKGLTKAQLNQLPVDTYKGKPKPKPVLRPASKTKSSQKTSKDCGSEYSSNDTCPICIGDYKIGEKLKTLPCMHRFHNDCVDKWLSMKSDCPVCKYDLLE